MSRVYANFICFYKKVWKLIEGTTCMCVYVYTNAKKTSVLSNLEERNLWIQTKCISLKVLLCAPLCLWQEDRVNTCLIQRTFFFKNRFRLAWQVKGYLGFSHDFLHFWILVMNPNLITSNYLVLKITVFFSVSNKE